VGIEGIFTQVIELIFAPSEKKAFLAEDFFDV